MKKNTFEIFIVLQSPGITVDAYYSEKNSIFSGFFLDQLRERHRKSRLRNDDYMKISRLTQTWRTVIY